MKYLSDYRLEKKVKVINNVKIYRGCDKDGNKVLIKILWQKSARPNDVIRFINSYELIHQYQIKSTLKPFDFIDTEDAIALIAKDDGFILLKEYVSDSPVPLIDFLDIAIGLTEILQDVHEKELILRCLHPDSILIDPENKSLMIHDFSLAVKYSKETDENISEYSGVYGDFVYMSPEQSGAIQRGVDYRSDYYSLGVILYELLTGQLPLYADNPDEWINVHVARNPEPPYMVRRDVPHVLSYIVMRLLSKAAEERYNTAEGLLHDLKECRRRLDAFGFIEAFPIGQKDPLSLFELPKHPIGREYEKDILIKAYRQTCTGKGQLMLINGYAGVGKTMFVNHNIKSMSKLRDYFGYGKFDQLKKQIPYAPLLDALSMVIKQIMSESKEQLEIHIKNIKEALGNRGGVMTQLIPDLEKLIGKQPQVEELMHKEARDRLILVFGDFIKAIAGRNSPLIFFLDDVQWADKATIKLIYHICQYTDLRYVMIIVAYRNNEITEDHPLTRMLTLLDKENIRVNEISLKSLNRDETEELIAETVHGADENQKQIADIVYRKTGGNPLFLTQMLGTIYKNRLVSYSIQLGRWIWDVKGIQSLNISDDLLDLILFRMKGIPGDTLDALKVASCIGNKIDISMLSSISKKASEEMWEVLLPAIKQNILIKDADDQYEFIHDKIRHSILLLLSDKEKEEIHVRIGRFILDDIDEARLKDRLLFIMDQLNRGLELIGDPAERLSLARYNLMAGRKANATVAFDSAISFFKSGIKLLPEDAWETCYELCYDLYLGLAQCVYMIGETKEAEEYFNMLIGKCRDASKKTDLYSQIMMLYASTGDYHKALKTGIMILHDHKMIIPENPKQWDYLKELIIYKWRMRNKNIKDLAKLPDITDPLHRKISEFLVKLILVTCTNYPDIYAYIIMKMGNYALRYGNTEMACLGYIGYSIVEGSMLGNYKDGYEFAKVALELANKYNINYYNCIVYFTIGAIILHWTNPLKEGLIYLLKAKDYALEAGNVLIAGYAIAVVLENKYLSGVALSEIIKEAENCLEYSRKVKHKNLEMNGAFYNNMAKLLMDDSCPLSLKSYELDLDEDYLSYGKEDKSSLAAYYFTKLQFLYFSGNYKEAISMIDKIKDISGSIIGFIINADNLFYHSLALAASYDHNRKDILKTFDKNKKKMRKWAESCPVNFLQKYKLLMAEGLRLKGKIKEAELVYDEAINVAKENGFINDEAIACELAAKFYVQQRRMRIASTYMKDAYALYRKWGAVSKALDLQYKYTELFTSVNSDSNEFKGIMKTISKYFESMQYSNQAESSTFTAIQNAFKSIYEERDPIKLPERFLENVVKFAHADKGYLILEKEDELFIEAKKENDKDQIKLAASVPLEQCEVCRPIVRYVYRTFEDVVINNNDQFGMFDRDTYILTSKVKSLACIPLQIEQIPVGVLYLENTLINGVFTDKCIELLKLLSNQMIYLKAMQDFFDVHKIGEDLEDRPYLVDPLTEREGEVLHLIAKGLTNKEIADRLEMTVNTVKTHIKNIYGKLQVSRRVQAVEKAKDLNILTSV